MRAMALVGCVISLICFVGFPSACLSQRADATMNDKPMIRYDANGIPNFIKGENLSASLDTDLFFRDLKKRTGMRTLLSISSTASAHSSN